MKGRFACIIYAALILVGCGAPASGLIAPSTAAPEVQQTAGAVTPSAPLVETRAVPSVTPAPPAAPTASGVIPATGTAGSGFMPSDVRVFGSPGGSFDAVTDGESVAWLDGSALHVVRLSDGHEYSAIPVPKTTTLTSISGDRAALLFPNQPSGCQSGCTSHVVVLNFVTGAAVPLTKTHQDETYARLSGDWLAWQAVDPLPGPPRYHDVPGPPEGRLVVTSTILAHDLKTLAGPVLLRRTTNDVGLWTMSGDRAFLAEQEDRPGGQVYVTLSAVDVSTRNSQALAQGEDVSTSFCDLQGDLLIYVTAQQDTMWAVNLRTGWSNAFPNAIEGTTDGRYIFWIDRRQNAGTHIYRQDIFGYDTATNTPFLLAANAGVNGSPQARGGVVLWMHSEGPYTAPPRIFVVRMAELGK